MTTLVVLCYGRDGNTPPPPYPPFRVCEDIAKPSLSTEQFFTPSSKKNRDRALPYPYDVQSIVFLITRVPSAQCLQGLHLRIVKAGTPQYSQLTPLQQPHSNHCCKSAHRIRRPESKHQGISEVLVRRIQDHHNYLLL